MNGGIDKKMHVINSSHVLSLMRRTLNHVDARLVDHGIRVAFLVSGMLKIQMKYNSEDQGALCILALLHDIGAYKTEEIDKMLEFETGNVLDHSIYGSLFISYLSPLKRWSDVILFHHAGCRRLDREQIPHRDVAQMIHLADRVDVFLRLGHVQKERVYETLNSLSDTTFDKGILDLFYAAEKQFQLLDMVQNTQCTEAFFSELSPEPDTCYDYLMMLIFMIDFRSQYTVTHTITTTYISYVTAKLMGLSEEQNLNIYYGALLHDLGKLAIPVEILEFPGKLSTQAMTVMKSHVGYTGEILGEAISPVIKNIAIHHHEKLDGSGYLTGLFEDQLTLEEQIVAVADIVSALLGTRSYKGAYSRDKTLSIIQEQAALGKINSRVVDVISNNFEMILDEVREQCEPAFKIYLGIRDEYEALLKKCQEQDS